MEPPVSFDEEKKAVKLLLDKLPPNICSTVEIKDGWGKVKRLNICLNTEPEKHIEIKAILEE